MLEKVKNINNLLENGEVSKAFDQALSLAKVNGSFVKDLKTLKVRFKIYSRNKNIGVLGDSDNIEFNKIIKSFFDLLEKIEIDFIENNKWVNRQMKIFAEDLFPFFITRANEGLISTFSGYFKRDLIDENLLFDQLEAKIDKDFWYIIHWRFRIIFKEIHLYISPENFDEEKKVSKGKFRKFDLDQPEKWRRLIHEIFIHFGNDYGLPIFAVKTVGRLFSKGIGVDFQFSSVMYPSQDDFKNYPWKNDD